VGRKLKQQPLVRTSCLSVAGFLLHAPPVAMAQPCV